MTPKWFIAYIGMSVELRERERERIFPICTHYKCVKWKDLKHSAVRAFYLN